MTANPTPADRVSASGDDVPPGSDSPMLIRYIYDTSSFSDILAKLTFVSSTTEPVPEGGDERTTERTNSGATKKGEKKKTAGN